MILEWGVCTFFKNPFISKSVSSKSTICKVFFNSNFYFRLHLDNIKKLEKYESNTNRVNDDFQNDENEIPIVKFGFDVPTSCGLIPLDNNWSNDWVVSI